MTSTIIVEVVRTEELADYVKVSRQALMEFLGELGWVRVSST